MPVILLIIVAGGIVGYFLRNFSIVNKIGGIIGIVIMALLFLLGVSVGANPEVVQKFRSIGSEALLIAAGCTVGSVLCGWLVYRYFFVKKGGKTS